MNRVLALRRIVPVAAAGLLAANILTACAFELVPGNIALALEPLRPTPDSIATQALATIEAAMRAPPPTAVPPSETPIPTATPMPTPAPVLSRGPAATRTPRPTAASTPTRTPTATPTPNRTATETALRRQINRAVAATLTAQPTATLPPTATPQPTSTPQSPAPEQTNTLQPDAAAVLTRMQMIGVVDGGGLVNLRTGPSTDYAVLMGVDSGEELLILGRNQDASWLQVRTADGTLGWMAAIYISTAQPAASYPAVAGELSPPGFIAPPPGAP